MKYGSLVRSTIYRLNADRSSVSSSAASLPLSSSYDFSSNWKRNSC